jgi:hypothetical protein
VKASSEPIIRFFSYHDAHPVALVLVLLEKFGVEWFEWEPETLKDEILHEFKTNSIGSHNWEKIQAARTLTSSVGFWKEWHVFEKVIQALNNNIPRFDVCQECSVAQLMAGVDIATTIREEPFSDEIARYVAACTIDEGVTYLPPPLDFAQELVSRPMYRCLVCGKVDLDDLDGRCDFCSGRFHDGKPLNMKASPHVPNEAGTYVEKFLQNDPGAVRSRFEELTKAGWGGVRLDDTVAKDVQAGKLMVATDYMNLRRGQLVEQLEELKGWVSQ